MGYRYGIAVWAGLLAGCQQPSEQVQQRPTLSTETNCNPAQSPCRATGNGAELAFRVGAPARALTPFPVYVTVQGIAPEAVATELVMEGMDMGQNRYRLERQDEQWQAQVTLPACASGQHDWVAIVSATKGNEGVSARFPFSVRE